MATNDPDSADSLAPAFKLNVLAGPEDEQRYRQVAAALFGGPIESVMIGRYRLAERLGEGGMATVFAAIDPNGTEVAIKLMHPLETARFEREIGVLAGLSHPRVVRYINHGVTTDGRSYLVMEKLAGEDLRSHLHRRQPSILECVNLGIDVADGLQAAHEFGCVHRDIKPSNLFLVDGAMDRAKILDFGLARARGVMPSVTNTGAVLGTIGYMAPEQARGDADLDHRADIFSLGCVLYEVLAGHAPFTGEHAVAILAKILIDEPRALQQVRPEVPARLARLVHSMLAKRPDDRPGSVRDVITALRSYAVDASLESAALLGPSVVSYREQRAVCLLLVAELTQPIDPTGATAVFELESRSRPTAMAYGASIVTLLDGSEILVFDLTGHEDALAQAARCALFIQAHRPAARLALAIGKAEHSGSSVVGRVIDEASLLLHAATPGNIIVDETTAEVLGSSFRLDRIGAHARLLAEPDETALHTLLGKPSRFVGRTREQSWLMGLFHQVIEESHAGAVVIVAPPGVGKTRLWREFTHAIVRGHDPLLLLIRCSVTLQGSPFAALGAALRREAGVVGSDSIEQARARILARFTPTVEQPATAKQAAYIADLCGINVDDGGTEMLALARRNPTELAGAQRLAALDWMQAEAQLRPLVIVVEDLHWCDDMTAEFVRSAVRELADCPLMMVATARPEVAARFPTPWPTPESELLSLAPLNARASEALVRQALGPTAANVIEHAVARAEGNPFFLEELVRTLRTNPSSTLPDRVLSVVQTRLLRLEDEQRRLLRAASVFGSAFDPRGVAWLLGNPMHDVTAMLERLIDEEVLSRDPTAESTTYRFRHALVGDAAYAMLSDADRPSAHLAAAEWLVAGGYEPAEIATHFTRGNEPRIAGEWWVRAARRALICSDVNATASYVERALDGGVTGDLLAEVRVVQGEVAIWLGDIATADRRAREGLALAAPGSVVWFTALRRAINCAYLTVRMPEVRELTARLQPFHGGRSSAYLFCVAEAAYILGVSGAVDEGRALSDGIEDLDDPTMSPLVRAAIHHARAAISSHDQQLWSGLVELERAIACYEHAADIRTAGRVRATLAWLFLSLGAPLRAEQCVREALPVAQRVSAGHTLLYLEAALSLALSRQGRIDEAKLLMTAVAHRARDAGEARLSGYIVIWHVTLDAETVPSNATIAGLREGLEHLRPFASTHLWASATLAVMLARRGEPSELREALALVHVGLGRLREFTSLLDDEFSVWSNFVEVLERGGAPEPADVATIEALRRVSRLHAQIDDESMRQAFAAYDPVVRLRDRARRRDLALPAA